jgi:hypothetical protein
MLSYKYYLNIDTRTVSKTHNYSPVMLTYILELTQSHVQSVNTAKILSFYYINTTLTLKRPPSSLGRTSRRPPGAKCDPAMKMVITNAGF